MQSVDRFLTQITTDPPKGSTVRSALTLPPSPLPSQELPTRLPLWLVTLLRTQGITHLAEPQGQALDLLAQGQHVCLMLPTGSGRGVVRLMAMYQTLVAHEPGHGLFIFPQKQRELAQFRTLTAWNNLLLPEHHLTAAIYDGDTPRTQRQAIRQSVPRLLLTTPEMLHAGILAYHGGWRALFQHLRYVVLADVHLCMGALGSHVAHLLRRVQRLARHYGAQPQYLLTSAPLANITEVARTLTAQPCQVVAGEALHAWPQHRVILEASADPTAVCRELVARHREANLASLILTPDLVEWEGVRSLAPLQGPRGIDAPEAYHIAELDLLQGKHAALALPRDTPVAAVRPGALSSIIFVGLPPSLTTLQEYLAVLASSHEYSVCTLILSGKTPTERYMLRYPAVYQAAWPQDLTLYPSNPHVARHHLHCAAAELALGAGERYAGIHGLGELIQQLAGENCIERRAESRAWVATQRPSWRVFLRAYTSTSAIINLLDRQYLARITPDQAFRECFEGAIYTHGARTFRVERHAPDSPRILVQPVPAEYVTRGLVRTEVTERSIEASEEKDPFRITYGACCYAETLWAFEQLDPQTRVRQSIHMLPERQRQFRTQGVWLQLRSGPETSPAALHALVHAVLASLPLLLASEGDSLRGRIDDRQGSEVVFTDTPPGGNGVSDFLYRCCERVLRVSLQILLQCDCTTGCEKCIAAHPCDTCASPVALNRQAGIALVQRLLGEVAPTFESITSSARAPLQPAPRYLYLTLSTQRSAEDVGGWQHKHLLGLGVAVTYDTRQARYRIYTAETVEALLASLQEAELVVGFNTRDFDWQVLQPYTETSLATLPTFAVLDEVQRALGLRLSLRHLVKETLGIDRPDDSVNTLQWYQEGDRDRIAQLCRRDLDLMRDLVRHGVDTGTLFYRDQAGVRQTLSVQWPLVVYHG